ncbi:dephospho-CoA kinase [Balneatrix alpica]|uniref:dephospho-CoA kinase n=1 Tax=Balneatrix alpica TaxID=75684 RepID=UPI0027397B38|nr:dephospho-CoA kinase [Balneatrix alpica]
MNSPTPIFGLTGGIGSGKSAAAKFFNELGIQYVDADQLAREVVEPGQPALQAIADHFGSALIDEQGQLRRAQLRQIIFADPAAKTWLEQLLHPLIRQLLEQRLALCPPPYGLLVSPLLFETGQDQLTQGVIVVDVSEQTQLIRTQHRDNNSPAQVRAIMQSQLPREQRLQQARWRLTNEGSLADLQSQIQALDKQLRQLINQQTL